MRVIALRKTDHEWADRRSERESRCLGRSCWRSLVDQEHDAPRQIGGRVRSARHRDKHATPQPVRRARVPSACGGSWLVVRCSACLTPIAVSTVRAVGSDVDVMEASFADHRCVARDISRISSPMPPRSSEMQVDHSSTRFAGRSIGEWVGRRLTDGSNFRRGLVSLHVKSIYPSVETVNRGIA